MIAAIFLSCLAALAVVILALTHLSVWVGSRETENEKEQDRRRDQENRSRQSNSYQPLAQAISARLESISNQLDAYRVQERHNDRKRTLLEVSGVTAAFAAAGFALWSAWIFQGQLREMEADHRAWIPAQPIIWHPRPTIPVLKEAGLKFGADGQMFIWIGFDLENIGHTPAFEMKVFPTLVALTDNEAGSAPIQEKLICGNESLVPQGGGFTLFPGEKQTNVKIVSRTKAEIDRAAIKLPGERRGVFLMVVGCVTYKFYLSDAVHTTPFFVDVRQIDRTNGNVPKLIDPDAGNVSDADLETAPSIIYHGNAD